MSNNQIIPVQGKIVRMVAPYKVTPSGTQKAMTTTKSEEDALIRAQVIINIYNDNKKI